jgi:hypothetical protein
MKDASTSVSSCFGQVAVVASALALEIEEGIALLGPARVRDVNRRPRPAQHLRDLAGRAAECRSQNHALNALESVVVLACLSLAYSVSTVATSHATSSFHRRFQNLWK